MSTEPGYNRCHCLSLRRGSRFLTRMYDSYLEPAGLTSSQFSLLSVIKNFGEGANAKDLGQILMMERTTLLRNLKPLLLNALISAEKAQSGRSYVYKLATQGAARLEVAAPLWAAAQADFERQCGAERAERLRLDSIAICSIGDQLAAQVA